jgi:CYTH domain-containing protein
MLLITLVVEMWYEEVLAILLLSILVWKPASISCRIRIIRNKSRALTLTRKQGSCHRQPHELCYVSFQESLIVLVAVRFRVLSSLLYAIPLSDESNMLSESCLRR